jgi:hypothetical protein
MAVLLAGARYGASDGKGIPLVAERQGVATKFRAVPDWGDIS